MSINEGYPGAKSGDAPQRRLCDLKHGLNQDGRPPGTRTPNQRIKSPLLYQLS